jgi:nucleoid DNA-binding protein
MKGSLTMTLTKTDLIDSIYNQVDLPKAKSAQLVDSLLEIIKKTLEGGERCPRKTHLHPIE